MTGSPHPAYVIRKAQESPLSKDWQDPAWQAAASLNVSHFHPKSSPHRPVAEAKMLYDDTHLYGQFRVEDQYVICTHTGYQTHVYEDSCVEFFVKPKPDKGYMNFEMNCGGGLLLYYIADCTRIVNPSDPTDEFKAF